MNRLITGGSGFIGSNLDGEVKVSTKDADLLDYEETIKLFRRIEPTTLIHAAAKHGNYAQIEDDKVGYYRENALININVFEAARISGIENLIAFSSVTAFPDSIDNFSEKDLYSGQPHVSCYPYAYAKRIIEVLCRAYREQYELNYNCIFLANAYGPGGRDNVIPTLIKKCLMAQERKHDLEVLGDGSPRRDFIFVDDVRRIINQLEHESMFGPLILSSGFSSSIREVVDEIVKAVNFEGKVIWKTDHDVGQEQKIPSNKRLMDLIPGFNFTHLNEGIAQTVDWHKRNYRDKS